MLTGDGQASCATAITELFHFTQAYLYTIHQCARLNAQSVGGFTLGWQRNLNTVSQLLQPSLPSSVFTLLATTRV